ncbi:MAG: hypothetical protein KGS60_02525 [Verrucomicrobia bacterium]|nr:hypothetical protein [Verrucomicrobiota bacterium]
MKGNEAQPEDWAARLIRLKRYETPGEGYFEGFLEELRERQRSEALRLSVVTLAKDRLLTWWRSFSLVGRMATAAGLATVVGVCCFLTAQDSFRDAEVPGPENVSLSGGHPALAGVTLVREF